MSGVWIQVSEKILAQLKRLEETEGKDRLELVRSLRFVMSVLQRSLFGWTQWVNNPDIMTRFTQADLEKMNKKLSELTRSFIEYDIEATKLGTQMGLKAIKKVKKKRETKRKTSYVA